MFTDWLKHWHPDWRLFLTALGLAFVLEGLPYFLLAERLPDYLRRLAQGGPGLLRALGLAAMLAGLTLVFLGRSG